MIGDLVSIIVPAYNVEKNIPYCLNSLINQTYKNIEIICVNDGSKDNTLNVIKTYAEKDDRIKLICQENAGVSTARNTGLDNAKGEYIAFVDSDDYVSECFIERLMELITNYSADIAKCRARGVNSYSYIEPKIENSPVVNIRNTLEALNIYYDGIFYGWYADDAAIVCNCLFVSKIFKSLRFYTNLSRGEDECIIQRAISDAEKVVYTDERLYFYFHNDNSLTHKQDNLKESLERIYLIYSDHKNCFVEKGFNELASKSCEFACNNISEIYVDLTDRDIKKKARKYFKDFFARIQQKPFRLILFRYLPFLYKFIIKLKKSKTA